MLPELSWTPSGWCIGYAVKGWVPLFSPFIHDSCVKGCKQSNIRTHCFGIQKNTFWVTAITRSQQQDQSTVWISPPDAFASTWSGLWWLFARAIFWECMMFDVWSWRNLSKSDNPFCLKVAQGCFPVILAVVGFVGCQGMPRPFKTPAWAVHVLFAMALPKEGTLPKAERRWIMFPPFTPLECNCCIDPPMVYLCLLYLIGAMTIVTIAWL